MKESNENYDLLIQHYKIFGKKVNKQGNIANINNELAAVISLCGAYNMLHIFLKIEILVFSYMSLKV